MLKWYKKLYVGDGLTGKEKKYIRKVKVGVGVIDIYLITLAKNPEDQLDIFSANMLLQKPLRRTCPLIVGIAYGYEEACELVVRMAMEVYDKTGQMHIRKFIEEREPIC